MTPERKKWWDSLPTNEKNLRVTLDENRRMLSLAKGCLTDFKGIVRFMEAVRKQKLIIKALKHELDRTTTMIYTGHYEGISPIYRCEKCGNEIKDIGQWYCCWCGRKIKERK